MKRKRKSTLDKNSLVMRNLVRHVCPPPTFHFGSQKQEAKRKACRNKPSDPE